MPLPPRLRRRFGPSLLVIALSLVAQATTAEPRQEPSLFISPMGEPFRAKAGDPYPIKVWFERIDKDHKGYITEAEFVEDSLVFFDRLDTRKKGVLGAFEISAYEHEIAPEVLSLAPPEETEHHAQMSDASNFGGTAGEKVEVSDGENEDAPHRQTGLYGASPYGLFDEPEPVAAADQDVDFRVTRAEWITAAKQRFRLLDVAKTGKLRLADLPKTAEQKYLERRHLLPAAQSPAK